MAVRLRRTLPTLIWQAFLRHPPVAFCVPQAAQEEQQEATAGGDGQGRSQREQVRARQRAEVRLTRKLLMIEAEAEGGDTVREEDADSVLGQLCSRMMDLDYVRNETVALIQGSDEKGTGVMHDAIPSIPFVGIAWLWRSVRQELR